ncbi:MAG: DUF2202 domain-containing protein [Paludibacter sp.]
MKTTNLFLAAMLSLAFMSCDDSVAATELDFNTEMSADQMLQTMEFTSDSTSISEAERNGLILMREEEKLAGDVYAYFYEKYALRPFTNINKSEVRHSDAVLRLLTYFGIPDPALTETGKFKNPDIQALYNKLTADGSTTENALAVGAFIEEYDIADLRKLIAETQNADIKMVYTNLLNGSYNHIKAFTRVLAGRGVTYSPQIISVDELNEIIK